MNKNFKTNIIQLQGFTIMTRDLDGFVNATHLGLQFLEGGVNKLDLYLLMDDTSFLMDAIQEGEDTDYVIDSDVYNDDVWMHPLLLIDFSMYLSPTLKYNILKTYYDMGEQLEVEISRRPTKLEMLDEFFDEMDKEIDDDEE